MKKIVVLLLAIILLAACTTPAAQPPATPTTPTTPTTPADPTPADPTPAEGGPVTDPLTDPRLNQPMDMGFLPKLVGGAFFNRMYDEGFQQGFVANVPGAEIFQVGPSTADAAAQNRFIQDMIVQRVDAILVTPVTPEQMEADLRRAREEGIIVVTYEGEDMENVDYNLEVFMPEAFGASMGERLGNLMDGEGEVIIFVSNLGATAHVAWADGAAGALREFPDITIVSDPGPFLESGANIVVAHERALEAIRAFPNVRGIISTTATDTPAIARAIEEAGMSDQIFYIGVSMPNASRTYVQDGVLNYIYTWDPSQVAIAMARVASAVRSGHSISAGDDLGAGGFHNVVLRDRNIFGTDWVIANADNVHEFDF